MSSHDLSEAASYPWYSIINDDSLSQGDLLDDYPLVVPVELPASPTEARTRSLTARIDFHRIIVLTQSCDLDNSKINSVVVCPVFDIDGLVAEGFIKRRDLSQIRKGYRPAYHMLNTCNLNHWQRPPAIVNFGNVSTTSLTTLQQFVASRQERIRLLPPYREHLSQAFARFFMRVGLPQDIPDP